jgi:3-hydroxybutyrate dehydrogenase
MLKGKSAIVTGSTSGIGLGIARALAGEGANIMLNGFGDLAEIDTLRAGLAAEFSVEVAFNAADISKPEQIRDLARQATKELGTIDILVNNSTPRRSRSFPTSAGTRSSPSTSRRTSTRSRRCCRR